MIGPVHLDQSELPRRTNLHYFGLKPHELLPAYARGFDIALIPFRITPATVHLNPVKTLEYMAAGLPIVSTRIPDIERFYSHIVHIASSHDEFLQEIELILNSNDRSRVNQGLALAQRASWQSMTDQINAALFRQPPVHNPEAAALT